MFCGKCGRLIDDNEPKCPYCENVTGQINKTISADENNFRAENIEPMRMYTPEPVKITPYNNTYPMSQVGYDESMQKSRLTAGLLQIFLGSLGIGRFYLGHTGLGIGQIGASFFSCGIAGFIWGIIDGVMILNGSVKSDSKNIPLKD